MKAHGESNVFGCLGFVVACTYLAMFCMVFQCGYSLVNDFRPYHLDFTGKWPGDMLTRIVNPAAPEYWLYRPVPELLEWFLAAVFRGHPGFWHVLTLGIRVVSIGLAWRLLVTLKLRKESVVIGTLFVALFPAIPELWMTYAEIWLIPLLLACCLGLVHMYNEKGKLCENRRLIVLTTVVFVLLSMCKEILVPITFVLFASYTFALWREGRRFGRVALVIMGLALAVQSHHCLMTMNAPYAASRVPLVERLCDNVIWIVKNLFLFNTNVWPVSLMLVSLFIAGLWRLIVGFRANKGIAFLAVFGLAASVGVNMIAPFQALRYLYPCAVMMVIVLGCGVDFLVERAPKARLRRLAVVFLALFLFLFNAPVLLAQAFVMWKTSQADWAFLCHVVEESSRGREIVLVENAFCERGYRIKAELNGVNMTGRLRGRDAGRYVVVKKIEDVATTGKDSLITLVNAFEDQDTVGLKSPLVEEEWRIDLRNDGLLYPALGKWRAFALKLNPRFEYVADAGSSRFPGHYWITYRHDHN